MHSEGRSLVMGVAGILSLEMPLTVKPVFASIGDWHIGCSTHVPLLLPSSCQRTPQRMPVSRGLERAAPANKADNIARRPLTPASWL